MNIKEWYEEAIVYNKVFLVNSSVSFVIYKGFKICKDSETYSVLDVRLSDFYSKVRKKHLCFFERFGFIKGVDLVKYSRDIKYKRFWQQAFDKMYQKKESLNENDKDFERTLISYKRSILRCKNFLYNYKIRTENFKGKYNSKDQEVMKEADRIEKFYLKLKFSGVRKK